MRRFNPTSLCLFAAVLAFLVMSAPLFADTVTFSSGVSGATSYTEANMVFEAAGGEYLHFTSYNGDLALDNSTSGHGIGIHLTDWSYFSLNGFDFLGGGDGQITFYDGSTQVAGMMLTGLGTHFDFTADARFAHINYMNFCGMCITAFGWANAIDNVDFTPASASPVPEPGSLSLLGTGITTWALRVRMNERRRKKAGQANANRECATDRGGAAVIAQR